ncbi:substrate-binding domain-containing protein [Bifidobacterium callimiconis]|uniref:Periplasmic binding protein-like domain-containing protein n=1 Tax=Bifidobacterium callimiconis TaxID=2306973 RepID=A0A430F6Z5_9BIFI|nr:substrate-binding domain-containing protein [Bifidobacterium callimiconis]MBT1178055.1 DeoR/GlpR family transcriptional regulator [Bifidobacterium callimiconis]RSX48680.1 Periplasmic binding protein-like domain-containing protein [Bifidobacterium callimiconis]
MPTPHASSDGNAAAPQRSYLPAERQDMILSLLTRENVVTVPALAKYLNTTEITVRRDLSVLAEAGLLRRVRGGAMSVGSNGTDGSPTTPATTTKASDATASNTASTPAAPTGEPLLNTDAIDQLDRTILPLNDEDLRDMRIGVPQPVIPQRDNRDKGVIGLMFPEPSFFWPTVIAEIHTEAAKLGYRVEIRESSYERIRENEILDTFGSVPNLRGIIACPSSEEDVSQASWNWIDHSPVPVVVAERDQPYSSNVFHDSVRTNHPYGVRKAINHFRERGHRHVAAAFTLTPTSEIIEEAWHQLVDKTNLLECPFVFDGIQPYDTHGVEEIVERTIDSDVTGLLVHSDYLAIALAQSLERHGKRVPADISIISVDGYATPSSRPLTVLRSPQHEFAAECLNTLLWRLEHPDWPARHILIDPRLIDRGSVATIGD